ncbi:MAG: DMT family transporter [Rhodobacteraceae bacterium]|nr:DMT family transporter [Paracoccaceae bacterium]
MISVPLLGEGFAIGAAVCWAIGPLVAYRGVDELGTFRFSMFRFVTASVALFIIAFALGQIDASNIRVLIFLAMSGIIGVAFGETSLFKAVHLLGPRRSSIIFALHAPLTAALGSIVFGETVAPLTLIGVVLAFVGVYTAVIFRSQTEKTGGIYHKPESARLGFLFVAVAVACQVGGVLLAKEVIDEVAPFFASFTRTCAAAIAFFPLFLFFREAPPEKVGASLYLVVASAMISTIGGMTFLLAAFANTEIVRAVVLSSMAPVIYILLIYAFSRERFPILTWIGSILAVLGIVITVLA